MFLVCESEPLWKSSLFEFSSVCCLFDFGICSQHSCNYHSTSRASLQIASQSSASCHLSSCLCAWNDSRSWRRRGSIFKHHGCSTHKPSRRLRRLKYLCKQLPLCRRLGASHCLRDRARSPIVIRRRPQLHRRRESHHIAVPHDVRAMYSSDCSLGSSNRGCGGVLAGRDEERPFEDRDTAEGVG